MLFRSRCCSSINLQVCTPKKLYVLFCMTVCTNNMAIGSVSAPMGLSIYLVLSLFLSFTFFHILVSLIRGSPPPSSLSRVKLFILCDLLFTTTPLYIYTTPFFYYISLDLRSFFVMYDNHLFKFIL